VSVRTTEGASNVCELAAGLFVRIDASRPKPGVEWVKPSGGTRYRLLAVHHDADERTKVYRNRFEAVPDDAPFVPPAMHPRPTFSGTTAAEVVAGPDDLGRFRLKFDLDRTGTVSDWAPMAHPEDLLFLPRPGERVSVEFVHGDLDRPLIRERLHTAATFPFDPAANSRLGGITTPAHKLWFESGDVRWALLEIAGRLRELIKGSRETVVEKDVIEKVLGAVNCTVEKSWAGKVGQQFGMEAKEVLLKAADRIVLTVGQSRIVIDANGITINGAPLLHLNPPGGVSASTPPAPAAMPEAPKRKEAKAAQPKPKAAPPTPAAKAQPLNIADLDAPPPNATDARTGRSVSLDNRPKPPVYPRSRVDAKRIDEETIADAAKALESDKRCAEIIDSIFDGLTCGGDTIPTTMEECRQNQRDKIIADQIDAAFDAVGINSKKNFERKVMQEAEGRELGEIIVDQEKNGTNYESCPFPLRHRQ
jgi:hypothetical protein